jgi:uncharacterized protein YcbK (DUF882 family)
MLLSRRSLIRVGAGGAALGAIGAAAPAWATAPAVRRLSLLNLHTDERCSVVYREAGECVPEALAEVNKVLRDFRTGEVHPIDTDLLDLLAELSTRLGASGPFHVISGYRSPKTNAMLSGNSSGVATRSLHMQGKAIDIRLPGRKLANLRDTALAMKRGGVGYYARSDFVHVDVGRVRRW